MNNKLYFSKVKKGAIIPTKESENAGYDIYACFEQDYITIESHKTVMIPTGIASACSEDYYVQLQERGSTGTKGMAQRCGVIDSGYRNEWFVPITNTNNKPITIVKLHSSISDDILYEHIIYPYEKAICQAVIIPVPRMEVKEISYEELKSIKSKRGMGALGSSNK